VTRLSNNNSILLPSDAPNQRRESGSYPSGTHLIQTFSVSLTIRQVICACLDDEVIEVRQMASTWVVFHLKHSLLNDPRRRTLSGILRCSPRHSILRLKVCSILGFAVTSLNSAQTRFVRLARQTHIPPRQAPGFQAAILTLHSAILGVAALIEAHPYRVPYFFPELLTEVLSRHTHSPLPISTTVHKVARSFKKTHQDTWHEDSKKFTEEELSALSTLLTGSSYCKCLSSSPISGQLNPFELQMPDSNVLYLVAF